MPELEKQLAMAQESETRDTVLLRNKVTEEEIAEVVSRWTGIPVSKMMEGDRENCCCAWNPPCTIAWWGRRRRWLRCPMPSGVPGRLVRPQAPQRVVPVPRAYRGRQNRIVQALADFLFDSEDAMVRIDMSEFMEKHSVARMIGALPAMSATKRVATLTEAVRRKPYSLLLLDEVEKAHPDVFNILLQVLEDGRLTDGQGRTVDFRNTVVDDLEPRLRPDPGDGGRGALRGDRSRRS